MLLRQVQARPLQGHHLRALRRRGDPAEGAPRTDGPHRPGRPGLAHLVLQGGPEPHRLPARHRPARAGEGALLRRLDHHERRHRGACARPQRPRGQGQGRGRAYLRRPRRGPCGPRAAAVPAPRVLRAGQGQGLRRGRRLLGTRPLRVGRGADAPDPRGGPQARRRPVRRARRPDHDRGREEDPGARPERRDPRGPQADPARARAGRERRRADPERPGRPPRRAGFRERLGQGRALEADQQDQRGAPLGRGTRRRGRRAGLVRRREEPGEGARARQRPPARGAGRIRRRDGRSRARERPVPPHRREDPEGGPRRTDPVGAQGARDVSRHRVAPRGHARGRGRLRQPARADLAALPRGRAQAGRQ